RLQCGQYSCYRRSAPRSGQYCFAQQATPMYAEDFRYDYMCKYRQKSEHVSSAKRQVPLVLKPRMRLTRDISLHIGSRPGKSSLFGKPGLTIAAGLTRSAL